MLFKMMSKNHHALSQRIQKKRTFPGEIVQKKEKKNHNLNELIYLIQNTYTEMK